MQRNGGWPAGWLQAGSAVSCSGLEREMGGSGGGEFVCSSDGQRLVRRWRGKRLGCAPSAQAAASQARAGCWAGMDGESEGLSCCVGWLVWERCRALVAACDARERGTSAF